MKSLHIAPNSCEGWYRTCINMQTCTEKSVYSNENVNFPSSNVYNLMKIIFSSLCFNSAKLIFRMNKNIDVSEKNWYILMWNFLMIIIFWSDFLGGKIKFTRFLIVHKKNESQTLFHHENIDHWNIVDCVVKG